jgi:protein O-mannosyl-transferase
MRHFSSTAYIAFSATLLVAATVLMFWPGMSGGYIFDDFPNLVREPAWRVTALETDQWLRAWGSGISSAAGRPLAMMSFAANHLLTGADPFWLKLTNVLLHALNGLLVFGVCRALFAQLPDSASRPGTRAAWFIALAWLLHPLQASTVLYVVQRMELGAATGALLGLWCYLRARALQVDHRQAWRWLVLSACAVVFGLGFKESALLAPGFAFLAEICLLHFRSAGGRFSRVWVAAYSTGAVIALLAYAAFTLRYMGSATAYASRDFTLPERLWTQLPVLATYLRQILLPLPETMTFYYDNFPISRGLLEPVSTLLSGLVLLALILVAIFFRRRWPLVSLGIGWFFVAHFLTSNVVPLELAFEHRNYLALLGILLALVQPVHALGRRFNADARAVTAVIPVLCLAWLCWIQAATWGDPMRLAWTLENRNPSSPRASYALGQQFVLRAGSDPTSPAWSLARRQFEHAADLPGGSPLALQAVILLDAQAGHGVPDTTWDRFRATLTADALGVDAIGSLHAVSACRIQSRCRFDDSQLMRTFLAVLQRNPGHAVAHTLYANFAWNVLGDRSLAIEMQREAVRLSPQRADLREGLARFEAATRRAPAAAEARGTGPAENRPDPPHR